jgi:ABC-2 type transport system ATP-binding protein
MHPPLRIDSLVKTYKIRGGAKTAVDSLTIEVPQGIIFGFLGPNGAGKTTTIKTVLDFIRPSSGSAEIFGMPSTDARSRSRVGYLPEQPYFHRFLRPIEVLLAHAALAGVPNAEARPRAIHALERAAIPEYAHTPIGKLSKGLTQRVGLAQALVGNPDLLILDEPTSGLDPVARRHVRDLLVDLKNEGKTVFLSSHMLSEVEQLCDEIAVLKNGRPVFLGKPEEAKAAGSRILVRTSPVDRSACDRLSYLNAQIEHKSDCSEITASVDDAYALMQALEVMGAALISVETTKESMEEAFLRLAA